MPNTLAHIGINGFITRSFIMQSDLLWILFGCIIPDIPWILRKVLIHIDPYIVGYGFQSYIIVQASLIYCLIISLSVASTSINFSKTLLILSTGSFFHLLLDSLQTKWANGVHLFAPFHWELTYFNLFWPESIWSFLITISGIVFLLVNGKKLFNVKPSVKFTSKNLLPFIIFIAIYFFTPIFFIEQINKNDCHFVTTLKNYESREGKYIEMDRKKIMFREETSSYWIESFDQNFIELSGVKNIEAPKISIKGYFEDTNLIRVENYHENWEFFRDGASYLGLAIIFVAWVNGFRNKFITRGK